MKTHRAVEYNPKLDDYDLPAEYPLDPAKIKPNPYASRIKAKANGQTKQTRQAKPNGSRIQKTVVAKRVYLYPHQIKILKRVDKNFSAAIRKVIDSYET